MEYIELGKTGMQVSRTAFGALPIQRRTMEESIELLRGAYEAGINFFDTARGYSDSEEKISRALGDVREKVFIATKTTARGPASLSADLDKSLSFLGYIDIMQFHNYIPNEDEYQTVQDYIRAGKIRHVGVSLHSRERGFEAVQSKRFETIQFPLSCISDEGDLELAKACKEAEMGFIAMKALAGGLILEKKANFAFLRSLESIVPIWGMDNLDHLEEFISLENENPQMCDEFLTAIEKEKAELQGKFCRGCGYCEPCPAGIVLHTVCKMESIMQRFPNKWFTVRPFREMMKKTEECTQCGICTTRCPYFIKTNEVVIHTRDLYNKFLEEHKDEIPDD